MKSVLCTPVHDLRQYCVVIVIKYLSKFDKKYCTLNDDMKEKFDIICPVD